MGHALFHVRSFYRHETGEMKPGKGVAINEDLLPDLLASVRLARRSGCFTQAATGNKIA